MKNLNSGIEKTERWNRSRRKIMKKRELLQGSEKTGEHEIYEMRCIDFELTTEGVRTAPEIGCRGGEG